MKIALCLVLGLTIGAPAVASATPRGAISQGSAHEALSKKPKKPKKPKPVPVPNPCDGR